MNRKIKVMIIDDHTLFRKGLREILLDFPFIEECKEARSGKEALEILSQEKFDILFLDIAMPDMDGIETLKLIKNRDYQTKILMLSMYPEEQYAIRALKCGASGYITKSADPEELMRAIEKIIAGGKYVPEAFSEKVLHYIDKSEALSPHEMLSERELQVFMMIARGKSLVEISRELSISIKTVSTYRARILEKLNLQNNAEIINYAIRHGLII
ncbi:MULTISPECIES: response regulator [Thermodesulfovibrio]|jgi:DNA-binding NarL/FixJ family response regulator|uniref:response regulator n=1 Tax=Thermodesulfovibrio TaxID=28261 RepID=UPI002610278A|nr:response regulator transcription factor [Thermodesulfovibrio sp.]